MMMMMHDYAQRGYELEVATNTSLMKYLHNTCHLTQPRSHAPIMAEIHTPRDYNLNINLIIQIDCLGN